MVQLSELWLPIVLSAVAVFIGSSVIWMALPFIHKHEYKGFGDKEPQVLEAIRSWGMPGGMYMFPFCAHGDRKKENKAAFDEKLKKGPWGVMMLRDKSWSMGGTMGLWFLNALILSAFVGYVASHALPVGAPYLKVFQIVGATGFLAFGGSAMTDCIWKGRPWNTFPGAVFDAVVYGCLMAGVFGWRWPHGITG
jgi:hypothetical protein